MLVEAPVVSFREPQIVFAPPADPSGTLTISPAFAKLFASAGLNCPAAFLELPGEVVSGHADRHVMRVVVPGSTRAFYLKRQHVVGPLEKLRNRLAGFGWGSRCAREAALLQQFEAQNLPAPRWAAYGTHQGRAFLLVEEVPDAVDLRRLLGDGTMSRAQKRALAAHLGATIATVHAAGFTTPDLTAKHVLVNPQTFAVTFLDWQSATRLRSVPDAARIDALGALHASLAPELATPADRLRLLSAYHERLSLPIGFLTRVRQASARQASRRSVRDQLQPHAPAQRLVWLAGEAVCAVPKAAAVWPRPVIGQPFYGFGPNGAMYAHFAGKNAVLVRGSASAPFGRFRAWLRSAPWRSEGVTIGRMLFHLQRYDVPAPQLLAFGQRLTSPIQAEWFALYEAPTGVPLRKWRRTASSSARRTLFAEVAACLGRLHAAGCILTNVKNAFAVEGGRVSIADPRAVRIVRRVSATRARRDQRAVVRLLGVE